MILIYTEKADAQPFETKFAASLDGQVEFRTARLWQGEIEPQAVAIYASDERIRTAYAARGVDSGEVALPRPVAEPEEAPKPKRRTTRKKSS